MKNVLVTGGCAFIGLNFVKYLISLKCYLAIILDKLTYARSRENINQSQLKELIKKLPDDYANYLRRLITN